MTHSKVTILNINLAKFSDTKNLNQKVLGHTLHKISTLYSPYCQWGARVYSDIRDEQKEELGFLVVGC